MIITVQTIVMCGDHYQYAITGVEDYLLDDTVFDQYMDWLFGHVPEWEAF